MPFPIRRAVLVVIPVIAIVILAFAVVDYNYLGLGQVDEYGLFYISGIQDTNGNASYTVDFHDVSFTFLHYNLPVYYGPNGTAYTIVDAPSTAQFMLTTYPDDEVEYLNLSVGGYVMVLPNSPLRPILGDHTSPRAGVATAFTPRLHFKWVLLVSL
jgi:hypothetical protein